MAAPEEQPPSPPSDSPVPDSSQTGRAVAVARLLHHETTHLLELYKEMETFLLDHTPEDKRMVSPSSEVTEPTIEEQVQLLHLALRQCLGLLHCLNQKEEKEWGSLGDNKYETMKRNVLTRLEHLLLITKDLVGMEGTAMEVTPDHQCNEEVDGGFALKIWIFRVLMELIHWADQSVQTLHVLHKKRGGEEEP